MGTHPACLFSPKGDEMKQYRVEVREVVFYEMLVDADDREAAEEVAHELFIDSDNPNLWFDRVEERSFVADEVG